MSVRRLPRQMGIWICCDGTDTTNCPERRFTANVFVKVNRAHWAAEGWGRGLRLDRKRRDQCPKHMELERELFAKEAAQREARKKELDELRKAKTSAAPLPKKPRKRKGSPAATTDAAATL